MSEKHFKGKAFMWPASGDDLEVERFEAEGIFRDQVHEIALDITRALPDRPGRWSGVFQIAQSDFLSASFRPRGDDWPAEVRVRRYRVEGTDSALFLWGEWRERDPKSNGAYDTYNLLIELDSEGEA